MNLKHRSVLVVGLGKTGEAVCTFLLGKGARIRISEKKALDPTDESLLAWKERGVELETGGHRLRSFLEADVIIPSPGVPPIPELQAALREGKEVLSEVELASRFLKGTLVGITGTNGKSTTATLTHAILKAAGLNSHLAGNIGTPLIGFADGSQEDDIYVTELSSFQLRYTEKLRASVAVFLNITPDHLDWHGDFEDYYACKKRLFETQESGDTAILNRDDPRVWAVKDTGPFRVYGFSQKKKTSPGCWVESPWMILGNEKQERLMQTHEARLVGIHNRDNIMASALVAHVLGVPLPVIRNTVANFHGLEHRLEKVTVIGGVVFYNDSKATNVDATLKSLESFQQPVNLILGGRDKGGHFPLLRESVGRKVRTLILIGEAREKIQKALEGTAPIHLSSDLAEAVWLAYSAAKPGDIVLLAPGCTSFDMFPNFEERGCVFKQEVMALKKRVNHGQVSR